MIAEVDIQEGLDQAWTNVATFVPKFLGFFLILLIGWFVAKALSKLTNSLLERVGFDTWSSEERSRPRSTEPRPMHPM